MANLQTLLDDFTYESLSPAWTTGDLASFSRGKTLWPYQQDALRHALLALVASLRRELAEAAAGSALPAEPDGAAVEALVVELQRRALGDARFDPVLMRAQAPIGPGGVICLVEQSLPLTASVHSVPA